MHVIFKDFVKSLRNFVHDFWEDCIRKPKLLLAVKILIYFNTSANSDIRNSRPLLPSAPYFLHGVNTSRVRIRPVLKTLIHIFIKLKTCKADIAKTILVVNHFPKRSIVDVWEGSECDTVLNKYNRVLLYSEYNWIHQDSEYAWLCLSISGYVWIYLNLP